MVRDHSLRRRLVVAVAAASLVTLAGAGTSLAQDGQPAEISFFTHVTPNLTAQFWQSQLDSFTAENPDVKVRLITAATGQADADFQTQVATGAISDVQLGVNAKTFQEYLAPIDPADPILGEVVSKVGGVENNLIDGQLYYLGPVASVTNLVWYNKDLFAEAGITSEPTTWEEFDAALAALKGASITPMVLGGEWTTYYNWVNLSPVFRDNPCWYGERAAGTKKFGDADWVDWTGKWLGYVKDGYFNEGALGLTYPQLQDAFLQGQAAMYVMGNWFIGAADATPPAFDLGVFVAPSDVPGTIGGSFGTGGFSIAKDTASPDAAKRLIAYLMGPGPLAAQLKADGLLSNVDQEMDLGLSPLGQEVAQIYQDAPAREVDWGGTVSCPQVPGIMDEMTTLGQDMYLNPGGDPAEYMARLDEFWDKQSKD